MVHQVLALVSLLPAAALVPEDGIFDQLIPALQVEIVLVVDRLEEGNSLSLQSEDLSIAIPANSSSTADGTQFRRTWKWSSRSGRSRKQRRT